MFMKKILLLFSLILLGIGVFSQEFSVNFTGRLNGSQYQRIDSVKITDVTRNWTETLVYPDTVIVVNATVNVSDAEMSVAGFEQNVPNPFDCYTSVELAIPQDENVKLQLFDAAGKQCADLNVALNAGSHRFEITASKPQAYILKATTGTKTYSVRMINVGNCGGEGIKYSGYVCENAKLTMENEFMVGDDMEFVGYATVAGNVVESEIVSRPLMENQDIVLEFSVETTGTLNGHDWVDLGLPSGILWATCNVGADSMTGFGNYYAWGETIPKTNYDWNTYVFCYGYENGSGSPYELTKYCYCWTWAYHSITDTLTILEACDDAATANWGAGWRMPGYEEFEELLEYCNFFDTAINGVNGRLYIGPNENSIFLPKAGRKSQTDVSGASGHYWSRSLYYYADGIECEPDFAWDLEISQNDIYDGLSSLGNERCYGMSVRPVCSRDNVNDSIVFSLPTLITNAATDITTSDATICGNIISDGGIVVTTRGFMYGTSANNLSQSVQSGNGTGSFTKTLTGLSYGTTYYYKAYATNAIGTNYGEVRTFTTIAVYLPTVTTDSASSVTGTGAKLSGNVTFDGNAVVIARGFMYGTSANNLSRSVQSGSGTGSFTKTLTGLSPGTTYFYKAYAINTAGTAYGDVMSFTTPASTGTVNGHTWVDLGLPSGTRWATCNVGASTPTDYGNYYAWGETTTKETYEWSTYRYYDDSNVTKYTGSDNLIILEASDDAATANWGSGWRMPTVTEMQELFDNCTQSWSTQNGVRGRQFTGQNGNSIFLPAAGCFAGSSVNYAGSFGRYWSSSLYLGGSSFAWILYLPSDDCYTDYYLRYYGYSVRPVLSRANDSITVSVPTVITGTASDITAYGATFYGDVISDGGATVTDRGFVYGTSANNLTQSMQCGCGTGTFVNTIGLDPVTTYYYKAYATNSIGTAYGEVMSFTTENVGDPTGTLNGHDWVDLGLPSGTRWATCNVGSTTPEGYGDYFAWGETSTKTIYTEDNYTYTGNPITLPTSADAATANWGNGWRMPTREEMDELYRNCTREWTTQNDVNGEKFIGPNGNSIFLPAAGYRHDGDLDNASSRGYYWLSSLSTNYSGYAFDFIFDSGNCDLYNGSRVNGLSVRPVCDQ